MISNSYSHNLQQQKWHMVILAIMMIALAASYQLVGPCRYSGPMNPHTLMGMFGAVFGLIVGAAMLVSVNVFGNSVQLIVGIAFTISSIVELIHFGYEVKSLLAIGQTANWHPYVTNPGLIGRAVMGLILMLTPALARRTTPRIDLSVILSVLSAAVLITLVERCTGVCRFSPGSGIGYFVEFGPLIFLALAFVVFIKFYMQERDIIVWWISLSIGVMLIGQIFLIFSSQPFDMMFYLAHGYLLIGNLIPLVGFFLYLFALIKENKIKTYRTQNLNSVLRIFRNVEQLLTRDRDKNGLLQSIADHLVDSQCYDAVRICLFDIKGDLQVIGSAGSNPQFDLVLEPILKKDFIVNDRNVLNESDVIEVHPPYGKRSPKGEHLVTILVRLMHENELFGLLAASLPRLIAETDEEKILFKEIAADIGFAILNIELEQVHRLVDELMQNEKMYAEVANRTKSSFLAKMSHELRTPLNSIIGFSNILIKDKAGRLSDKDKVYIERILSNGKHLLSLINEILDLSKVESGKMDLNITEFDLKELVSEIMILMRGQMVGKQVRLLSDLPTEVSPIVADSLRLKQVIINLVGNAVKFTEEGSVTVRVVVDETTHEALHLDVTDTGIGIPSDRLDKIFDPFEQADANTSRVYGGTGLGLSISRSMVELMGFALSVTSETGKGSTFSIYFSKEEFLEHKRLSHSHYTDTLPAEGFEV